MAAYCSFLGNSIGGSWNGKNDDRGFEDQTFAKFFLDAISECSLDKYKPQIENYENRILKFPQFVMCGNTDAIVAWHTHRPNLKVLLMVRDTREVYHSLKRNGMNVPQGGPDKFSDDLDSKLKHFVSVLDDRTIDYETLIHDDFINSPEEGIETLGGSFADLQLIPNEDAMRKHGVSGDTPLAIWEAWFDKNKVTRHNADETS